MQIYPVVPIMLLYQGCPHNASIPGMFWFLKRGSQDAIKDHMVCISFSSVQFSSVAQSLSRVQLFATQ